ncbi:NYN domain-containing protein [Desulfatibacillum aliphaticivorans]|uniref:NYN domain-containing protein n=1 Tax=Desulfatibacillum aliphaticivorans TaxID=218208 RepID=UPI000480798C|nr:NYN domain-containing protein [Desulfatibacillum aliphaticivorans]
MTKVNFLVDGFNLYHSTREAQQKIGNSTKWLNLKEMLFSYHPHYTKVAGQKVTLGDVYYFSAFARHRIPFDPDVVKRHKALIKCFEDTGVIIQMHEFKRKNARCPSCKHAWHTHEEKETDVAIAVKLMELYANNSCGMIVILSGDTDIAPAVKTSNVLYPDKKTIFAFPYGRKNESLKSLSPDSFKVKSSAYQKHQFPDPYQCSDGKIVVKPKNW